MTKQIVGKVTWVTMAIYFVYLLECSNGSYYTGYTTDMDRRYQEHLSGSAKCKYTRSFPPRRIAACWQIDAGLSQTLKIEAAIKRLSKSAKRKLSKNPESLWHKDVFYFD